MHETLRERYWYWQKAFKFHFSAVALVRASFTADFPRIYILFYSIVEQKIKLNEENLYIWKTCACIEKLFPWMDHFFSLVFSKYMNLLR